MLLDELVKADEIELIEWNHFFDNAPHGIIEKIRQESDVSRPTITKILAGDDHVKKDSLEKFRNWMNENAKKYIAG